MILITYLACPGSNRSFLVEASMEIQTSIGVSRLSPLVIFLLESECLLSILLVQMELGGEDLGAH